MTRGLVMQDLCPEAAQKVHFEHRRSWETAPECSGVLYDWLCLRARCVLRPLSIIRPFRLPPRLGTFASRQSAKWAPICYCETRFTSFRCRRARVSKPAAVLIAHGNKFSLSHFSKNLVIPNLKNWIFFTLGAFFRVSTGLNWRFWFAESMTAKKSWDNTDNGQSPP